MNGCVDRITLCRFQDGELPAAEVGEIERHLAGCPACQQNARQIATLHQTLATGCTMQSSSRADCPDELALASLAEDRLPDAAREQVLRHVAACDRCAAGIAALGRELQAVESAAPPTLPGWVLVRARMFGATVGYAATVGAESDTAESDPATAVAGERLVRRKLSAGPQARRRPGELTGWLGAVSRWLEPMISRPATGLAAVAAVVLVMVLWLPQEMGFEDAERGGDELPVIELIEPANDQAVASAAVVLRWQAVAEAANYTVTVVDASGEFFWQRATPGTSLELPRDREWIPGTRYSWWVTVLMKSGRRQTSEHQSFVVRE
jgi:anti-sigma factor RsiW